MILTLEAIRNSYLCILRYWVLILILYLYRVVSRMVSKAGVSAQIFSIDGNLKAILLVKGKGKGRWMMAAVTISTKAKF